MYIQDKYIFGNKDRIFLNTNLGCISKCSYCYLPKIDISNGTKINNFVSVLNIIKELNSMEDFIKGRNGTILSIGCYSECWDKENQKDTIALLAKILPYGNPVQLATKCQIDIKTITPILSKILWDGQLNIYISNSTISNWDKYEEKTTKPYDRFLSFLLAKEKKLNIYLYIKPVLKNITIQDIDNYVEIVKKYKIEIILGELFSLKIGVILAPIGENNLFYDENIDCNTEEYLALKNRFEQHTKVYRKSIEPILKKRRRNGNF